MISPLVTNASLSSMSAYAILFALVNNQFGFQQVDVFFSIAFGGLICFDCLDSLGFEGLASSVVSAVSVSGCFTSTGFFSGSACFSGSVVVSSTVSACSSTAFISALGLAF